MCRAIHEGGRRCPGGHGESPAALLRAERAAKVAAKREARAANSTRYRAQQLRQADDAQRFIAVTRDLALEDRATALEQHIGRLGKQEGSHRAERAVLSAELAHVHGAISAQKRAQFLRTIGIDPMLSDHDVTRTVYHRAGLPQPSEAALVAAYGARTDTPAPPTNPQGHTPDVQVSPVSGNIGALPGEPVALARMHKRRDLIAASPSHNPETLRRLDARIAAAEAKSKVHQAHRAQGSAAPVSAPADRVPPTTVPTPEPRTPRVHVPPAVPSLVPPAVPSLVPPAVPSAVPQTPAPTSVDSASQTSAPAATAPSSTAPTGKGHMPHQRESRSPAPSPEVVDANRQRVRAMVDALQASGQPDDVTRAQIAAVRDSEPADSPLRVALSEAWEALTPVAPKRAAAPKPAGRARDQRVSPTAQPTFIQPAGGGSPFEALQAQMPEQEHEEALARVRAQRDAADARTSSSFLAAVADLDD
ncbi:Uncharacterised protein [Mycobacteroides abscessus subsp. abscessus]|uniref:hypothetical protein n=1 Tax=Mycobacteroides abscessus TaxID=36809 RepID=UPI00092CBBED|nr:hypothetical protein [Mycobacteroides abscessus]SIC62705.1 Uncharacterised protein [Mycobacteroides abscessus subsp. abscessus]SIG63460.1 Uncharacterised protein [Mycobacteroides abscessus subsp. abscessus]